MIFSVYQIIIFLVKMPEPPTCIQSPTFFPLLLSPRSPHPGLQTPSQCPPCPQFSLSWVSVSHSLSHYQLTRDGPGFCFPVSAGRGPLVGSVPVYCWHQTPSVLGGSDIWGDTGPLGLHGHYRGTQGSELWRHTNKYRSRILESRSNLY